MAAPILDMATGIKVEESVVWDMYRALCGAILGSSRTEVFSSPSMGQTESMLFKSAAALVMALRAEAAGESPEDALADAHAWLLDAIGFSPSWIRY